MSAASSSGTDLRIFGYGGQGAPAWSWGGNSALTSNLGNVSGFLNHAGVVNNLQSRVLLVCGGYQVKHIEKLTFRNIQLQFLSRQDNDRLFLSHFKPLLKSKSCLVAARTVKKLAPYHFQV